MKLVDLIKGNLKEIITKHCTQGHSPTAPWVGTRSGLTISMDAEAMQLLFKTVRDIMKFRPAIEERITAKYMQGRLIDIIYSCQVVSLPSLDSKLLKDIKKLLRKLQHTSESWVFLVPVVNLKLSGIKKIAIGEVDFYDLNHRTFKYLESKYNTHFGLKKLSKERLSELTKNNVNVLAITEATAGETEKAQEIALFKVESSLNILRLYDHTRDMGIQREIFTAFPHEHIYHQNLRTKAVGSSYERPPPFQFFPYLVSLSKLQLMRKKGKFSEFNKILRGVHSTRLTGKIAMSIYWYGLGVKDKKKVDSFIKLIVALESLLLEKKDRPKKRTLADRIAFILGKDKKTREKLHRLVVRMYSVRSDIVHEGKHDISEEDTRTMINLVKTLIFKMIAISTRLQSLKKIDQRIKEIKFGSQIRGV